MAKIRRLLRPMPPMQRQTECPRCARKGKLCKKHDPAVCPDCRPEKPCIQHCDRCKKRQERQQIEELYPSEIRYAWSRVRSAILHSGDILDDDVVKHALQIDLALLPTDISDVFFVLSAQAQ